MKLDKIIEDITTNSMIIFSLIMIGIIDFTKWKMPEETFYAMLALAMIIDIVLNDVILYEEEEM